MAVVARAKSGSRTEEFLKVLRFCLVGGVTAATYAGVSWVLVRFCGFSLFAATTIAFLLAIPINYLGHKLFSFRAQGRHRSYIPRFLLAALASLAVNYAVIWLFGQVGAPYLLTIAVVTVLTPMVSYLANRLWVFAP